MEDEAWYIDAMDALGGLGFVSRREDNLLDFATDLDIPGYAISAPDFRPEPLTSRALAFAGVRRGLQPGLWDEGREVAFDSLESIVEFIRRVYLAAAGRGNDGGGEPPAAVRPAPEPTPRPWQGPAHNLVPTVMSTAKAFAYPSSSGEVEALSAVSWPAVKGGLDGRQVLRSLCAYGSLLVMAEVVRRAVGTRDPRFPPWWRTFTAAQGLLADFVLPEERDEWMDEYEVLLKNAGFSFKQLLERMALWRAASFHRRNDVVGTLLRLPVDPHLAQELGHRRPAEASLFDVMRVLVAHPAELHAHGDQARALARLALLVLGATVIVQASAPSLPVPDESDLAVTLDAEAIWSWLLAQLPRACFGDRLEQLIAAMGTARAALATA